MSDSEWQHKDEEEEEDYVPEATQLPEASYAKDTFSPSQLSISIWDDIDLSESYLVCCMFEEAASLASSVIHRMHDVSFEVEFLDHAQMHDIMEAAGMVFVQAFNELGRSSEIFVKLQHLYGSIPVIPGQVFLTGACIQIAAGHGMMLRSIFEQFLEAWKLTDEHDYVSPNTEIHQPFPYATKYSLVNVENYLQIVDVYLVKLLGVVLHDIDSAISWTENANLPQAKQQQILSTLRSMCSIEDANFCRDGPGLKSKFSNISRDKVVQEPHNCQSHSQPSSENSSRFFLQRALRPCFWWFNAFGAKCETLLAIRQHGKLVIWSTLFVLVCYILRKKRAVIQRIAVRHALSLRKILLDFWQLAFSVQVNPLAAVQSLPSPHAVG